VGHRGSRAPPVRVHTRRSDARIRADAGANRGRDPPRGSQSGRVRTLLDFRAVESYNGLRTIELGAASLITPGVVGRT